MTGSTALYFGVGFIIGGIIFWFIAVSRFQRKNSEIESRASSAEAIVSELRQQNDEKEEETEKLRNELNHERQAKVEALTRLEVSEKQLKEEMERLMDPELRETVVKHLKKIGYTYVTLDLQGFRSGSMNEVLR